VSFPPERTLPACASRLLALSARVVYTDLDGTMLGRGGAFTRAPDGTPAVEPSEALVAALAKGIDVVPCSGRAHRGLVGDGRILGMPTVIADMGAVISYDTGRELVFNLGAFPGGDEHPVRVMEREGAVDLILSQGTVELHMPWAETREYTQLFRGRLDVVQANEALRDAGFDWLQLVDNGKLSARYLDLPEGESHVYHLMPLGVSKGSAIAVDQERRSLSPGECVAIGDAIADLEIASEVAVLVLVRDAVDKHPALAEKASAFDNVIVTSKPGSLGWAEAMALLAR
jgi:predicted mannosyl-3-phosphoglycerate phosphatase (HAD superfamily)